LAKKTELKEISALQLLAHLTEETKLAIFRDLNRIREESFIKVPSPGSSSDDFKNDESLKLLEALEKEQREEAKKPPRMLD
jgi:hypothetical protein